MVARGAAREGASTQVPVAANVVRMRSDPLRVRPVHPLQWLWEPLQDDPGFALRPMFGGRAAYLDGRLCLFFAARTAPWSGVLVCTSQVHHEALLHEYPALVRHPVLPKWLYLEEEAEEFESEAPRLVELARRRDPRIGIEPRTTRRRRPMRP